MMPGPDLAHHSGDPRPRPALSRPGPRHAFAGYRAIPNYRIALSKVMTIEELEPLEPKMLAAMEAGGRGE
jgi:hypothetical protein